MKNFVRAVVICLLAGSFAAPAFAETNEIKPENLKTMLKGKDSFSVKPPAGWTVNMEDANARDMYAYFLMQGYAYDTSPAMMYIRVMDKSGLSVADHLKGDMDYYRENNIKVVFDPLKISGLSYAYEAKKYRIENETCDYVCYLDPGRSEQSYLIFALTTDMKHCADYKGVFVDMVKSFSWGSGEAAQTRSPK